MLAKTPPLKTATDQQKLYERYNRRATKKINQIQYNRIHSPRGRLYSAFCIALSTVAGGYVVFYSDFGEGEHCFTSARAWYARKQDEFWTLSEKEKQDLKDQGKL
ncbi:5046_t:CDS:2 [Acaulospora morrowiae]|uniref:5046_t:CDS:1 n=1 Tax=Acaulospora morrowiae TaxID=94023 RepID=A0A9N9A4R1_9GLOM|nr:5046_t:CDS:2 [Acaulospora morrowiae]